MKKEYQSEGPEHDLGMAINHYISTGDFVGEALTYFKGDRFTIVVPYRQADPVDAQNWRCLEARLIQMRDEDDVWVQIEHGGENKDMTMMLVTVLSSDTVRVTTLLKARPGPLGWGSMYAFLRKHGMVK